MKPFPSIAFVFVCVAPCSLSTAQCELQALLPPDAGAPDPAWSGLIAQDGPRFAALSEGIVHVFRQEGLTAFHESELLVPDAVQGDVTIGALVLDGDTLAFEVHAGLTYAPNVRVYERRKGAWRQTAQLLPRAGEMHMGRALALDGDRLVVSLVEAVPGQAIGNGALAVYERSAGVWTRTDRIAPNVANNLDGFGTSLDLEGERLAVGETDGRIAVPKRSFVFEHTPAGWLQEDVVPSGVPGLFGQAVDLRGDELLVSAKSFAGELARLFRFDGRVWNEVATLATRDALSLGAGGNVALGDGGRILVGAPQDDDRGRVAGAVYVFRELAGTWLQTEKLFAPAPARLQAFGAGVTCEGDLAIVTSSGALRTYSVSEASCHTLSANPDGISLTQGGRQTLRLNPGAEFAGKTFWLLGSATGFDPGFRLRGARVPLVPDWYFRSSLPGKRQAPFVNNLGVLRANAPQATVTLDVPPGTSLALLGLRLTHAFVVFDGGGVVHVSNTMTLTLVP